MVPLLCLDKYPNNLILALIVLSTPKQYLNKWLHLLLHYLLISHPLTYYIELLLIALLDYLMLSPKHQCYHEYSEGLLCLVDESLLFLLGAELLLTEG